MSALVAPADLARTIRQLSDRSTPPLPDFKTDAAFRCIDILRFGSEDDMWAHMEAGTIRIIGAEVGPARDLSVTWRWAWTDSRPLIVEYPAVTS